MCGGKKNIKWAIILLPNGAFSRMWGKRRSSGQWYCYLLVHLVECLEGKKDQVANDIATHWCIYFLLLKRLKNN